MQWASLGEEHQDYILADYVLDVRDEEGEHSLQLVRDTLSGLQKLFPRRKFRTSWAVTAGWAAQRPPQQAPPMPESLCYAMVVLLFQLDQPGIGLCLLLCFCGLMRVGEVLNLRLKDMVIGTSEIVVLLARTKRGEAERVVLASDGVVGLIKRYVSKFEVKTEQLVCQVPYSRVRAWIPKIAAGLGFQHVPFRSHSFRRGGATTLFMSHVPLQTIMHLGRWKSEHSCRMYIHQGEASIIRLKQESGSWPKVEAIARLVSHLLVDL